MKARGSMVLTALFLGLFCFSSAGAARAASVTGGGTFQNPSEPSAPFYTIAVSAHSGPGGPQGILRVALRGAQIIGQVVDLCVQDNRAFVVVQITQSTAPGLPVGLYLYFWVEDNGTTGDRAAVEGAPSFVPCSPPGPINSAAILTSGNITVTP